MEDLSKTKFKECVELSGFTDVGIYYEEATDYAGRNDLFDNKIFINSRVREWGLSDLHEKGVLFHELGHHKHKGLHLLLGVVKIVLAIFFIACVLGAVIVLIYAPGILGLLGSALCLVFAIMALSTIVSLYLFAEVQADDYAREMMARIGAKHIIAETTILLDKVNPQNPRLFKRVTRLILPKKEETKRRLSREWIWFPRL